MIPPNGGEQTASQLADRVFLVAKVSDLYRAGLQCCFSNYALNSTVPEPVVERDQNLLETHINWALFDDEPMAGPIPEIGYGGSCQYFHSRPMPERYQLRKPIRMAEFLIHTAVPLRLFACIVAPNEQRKILVQHEVQAAGYQLPVFSKPECFVS